MNMWGCREIAVKGVFFDTLLIKRMEKKYEFIKNGSHL